MAGTATRGSGATGCHGAAAESMSATPAKSGKAGASPAQTGSQPRLLYILGSGRSGSTLLDALMNSQADVIGVGEFYNFSKWVQQNRICTCGQPIRACDFWAPILKSMRKPDGHLRKTGYREAPATFSDLVRVAKSVLAGRNLYRRETDITRTRKLLQEIARASSAQCVVDSSKQVRHLLASVDSGLVEPYVVHLVRDPRGYIWSRGRRRVIETPAGTVETAPVPPRRAIIHWLRTNIAAFLIGSAVFKDRYAVVFYEDLARDPERTVQRLRRLSGLSPTPKPAPATKLSHAIAGNNSKFSGFGAIALDERWRDDLPRHVAIASLLLCGWLRPVLARYRLR